MSVYGTWVPATIAEGASTSTVIDLGRSYDYLMVIIPPMDACELYLQVAEQIGGTYYDLGRDTATDKESFDRAAIWMLGGFQYIKVVATQRQSAQRLIRIRGMRY